MRMGKVQFAYTVIVDLDDPRQVARAKESILTDLQSFEAQAENFVEEALDLIEDPCLTRADIPTWLLEDLEEDGPKWAFFDANSGPEIQMVDDTIRDSGWDDYKLGIYLARACSEVRPDLVNDLLLFKGYESCEACPEERELLRQRLEVLMDLIKLPAQPCDDPADYVFEEKS